MSNVREILKCMGVVENYPATSGIRPDQPVAHPKNCKTECPYGKGKAFCFPCMNQIMREHRATWKVKEA